MLHIKINFSLRRPDLQWCVDAELPRGRVHRLCGANGAGKTSLLEELKLHWSRLFPQDLLGFCDQATLVPFQDLVVAQVMDIVWEASPRRQLAQHWRELPWWQEASVLTWLQRRVGQLSGGENQWVKILMMRSLKSDVWLLDEPFQSLDHQRQQELWQWLMSESRTLLLVHHGSVEIPTIDWELIPTAAGLSLRRKS